MEDSELLWLEHKNRDKNYRTLCYGMFQMESQEEVGPEDKTPTFMEII